MNNKGFVASALLYGILVLFLTIVMMTMSVLGNRKLTMDKLKDKALNEAESSYSSISNLKYNYEYQNLRNNDWKNSVSSSGDLTLNGMANHQTKDNFISLKGSFEGNIPLNAQNGFTFSMFFRLPNNSSGTLLNIDSNLTVEYSSGNIDIVSGDNVVTIDSIDDKIPNSNSSSIYGQVISLTIVCQRAGSENIIYYYINGNRNDNYGTITASFSATKNPKFIIGNSSFNGDIYNIKIYDTTIPASSIKNNYNYDVTYYNIKN